MTYSLNDYFNPNIKVNWHIVSYSPTAKIPQKVNRIEITETIGLEKYTGFELEGIIQPGKGIVQNMIYMASVMAKNGAGFKDGDYIEGLIFGKKVKVSKSYGIKGNSLYRLVIPDDNNIYPGEEGCESPFSYQMLTTQMIFLAKSKKLLP